MSSDDINDSNKKQDAASDAIQDIDDANIGAEDANKVKGGFNPQPDPPKIRGFDPQPDPPIFNKPKLGY